MLLLVGQFYCAGDSAFGIAFLAVLSIQNSPNALMRPARHLDPRGIGINQPPFYRPSIQTLLCTSLVL